MAIDLNDTEPQRDRNLVPRGPYQLKMQINYGGAGADGALRRAKNGRTSMLELECTVTQGEHRRRKIWDYITLELDENARSKPTSSTSCALQYVWDAPNCARSLIARMDLIPTILARRREPKGTSKAMPTSTDSCFGRNSTSSQAAMATGQRTSSTLSSCTAIPLIPQHRRRHRGTRSCRESRSHKS